MAIYKGQDPIASGCISSRNRFTYSTFQDTIALLEPVAGDTHRHDLERGCSTRQRNAPQGLGRKKGSHRHSGVWCGVHDTVNRQHLEPERRTCCYGHPRYCST